MTGDRDPGHAEIALLPCLHLLIVSVLTLAAAMLCLAIALLTDHAN